MNHWLIRPAFWLGLMLVLATLITALFTVYTAYQTRQLYSALQETRAERDRLRLTGEAAELEAQMALMESRLDAKRQELESVRDNVAASAKEEQRRQR